MNVVEPADLAGLNTLAVPASAAASVVVESKTELVDALAWAGRKQLAVIPLGSGSNVVLGESIEALLVLIQLSGIEILQETSESVHLKVAAGEDWHKFVEWTLEQGFYGLENLALIPGLAGAAPIQNIGAYGVELSDFLGCVHIVEIASGAERVLSAEECELGYRDSIFKHALRDKVVVTALEIELCKKPSVNIGYPALRAAFDQDAEGEPTPEQVFAAVVDIRQSKLPDPAVEPNAGSFFKNPVVSREVAAGLCERFPDLPAYPQGEGDTVKLAAAWLIEHCGWKGKREGGVGVHPRHALVLVNYDSESGEKLLSLAQAITGDVHSQFGIELEIEPRIYAQ
jgi:UDP-N-acetylmuramate dehydrogenase